MKKKVLLINPKEADLGYFQWPKPTDSARQYVLVADLATTTVAKFMEPYFDVQICDASIEEVDYDTDADIIGITGKVSQWGHMKELSERFRGKGKTVMIGGSYASLSPDKIRPYADILVVGEIEAVADEIFAEIASGNFKSEYQGNKPDLSNTPIPRWDLYPNHKALIGSMQISRGCPFQCEFCDVIEYLGRNQRHKSISNIIAELEEVYRHGYRVVFLSDDNLTIYRKKAKEILKAIGDWNRTLKDGHMLFITQVSIDIAKDQEMMELASYAGLIALFIGIETPNVESLKESRKFQNLRIDLVEQVHTVLSHGFSIYGGLIVGFDNDKVDIFERQFDFIQETAVPYFTYGLLNAPDQTRLKERLEKEGRIIESDDIIAGHAFDTNIKFKGMSNEEAQIGSKWLINNMYDPDNFGDRLFRFLEYAKDGKQLIDTNSRVIRPVYKELIRSVRALQKMGEGEARLYERSMKMQAKYPKSMMHILNYLGLYVSVRTTMQRNGTWDPSLVGSTIYA